MNLKSITKKTLQSILGKYYLYIFSLYRLVMFNLDGKEKQFREFLKSIKPDSNILDIGANLGIITYYFSKRVKSGKVFSFEPIPQNFNILQRIVGFFRLTNVEINPSALGNENKQVTMVLPEESGIKLHALSHIKDKEMLWFNKGNEFIVEMKRLDDIPSFNKLKIDIIKMDVENYEFEVLKGGMNLITKNMPVIICELWKNENRTNTINLLESLGYKTIVLIDNKFIDYSKEKHDTQDFFFIPKK